MGIVGALPEERDRAQPLEIDLDLVVDMGPSADSDELTDTVDYGAVCDLVVATVEQLRPQLLERLGAELARVLLAHDDRIESVRVALRKLRPPVPHLLESSGVVLTRHRAS